MTSLPRVIVFDLDGTLWSPEMYELWHGGGAPFACHPTDRAVLVDRAGTHVRLLGEALSLLEQFHSDNRWQENKTIVAISSTCDEPSWARQCLKLFTLDTDRKVPMERLFPQDFTHIRSGPKSEHFKAMFAAVKKVDPTVRDFSSFLFFDNQKNNIEDVSKLGVCCVYCRDGMVDGVFENGLQMWRKHNSSGSSSRRRHTDDDDY